MFQLIGITVSYHYDDYLKYCLSNTEQLDHWYLVVDEYDTPTLELLKDIPNITLVYFDFNEGGSTFNKSGGLRKAQEIAHAKYPEAWILLLDSDIVLPPETHKTTSQLDLKPDFLYGARRAFYLTPEDLEQDRPCRTSGGCWGFFHLYFDKQKLCMERSHNAARYDDNFMDQFRYHSKNILTVPYIVKHLGDERQNWDGRRSKRFEKAPSQIDLKIK